MIRCRLLLSGYALLTCALVLLYPFASYSDQTDFSGELDSLLTTLNIPHTPNLDNMIAASQVWRRSPLQERWQLKNLNIDKATHDRALIQLQHLDLVEEIKPDHKTYDYVLLLGARLPIMQKRLEHMINLWETGIRFNKIVILVGLRPMVPGIDQIEQLTSRVTGEDAFKNALPVTELEGAEMVYRSTNMPDAMGKIPVEYMYTPRRWENNHWQRANTRETAATWVKSNPTPGLTLVMSEQPNAHYQLEVIRQELPNTFPVDLAARAAGPDTQLVIFLDALALWLHNLQKQSQSEISIPPTWH